MYSLPGIILLYLAAPFLHRRCFWMRFKQLDKLYFTEVYEHDPGEYRLTVTRDGVEFENKIILSG